MCGVSSYLMMSYEEQNLYQIVNNKKHCAYQIVNVKIQQIKSFKKYYSYQVVNYNKYRFCIR